MERDIPQKLYLTGRNGDLFVCPTCLETRRIDRSKLSKMGPKVVVKCNCGRRYQVELRNAYRKKTEIPCAFKSLRGQISGTGTICDISMNGLRIEMSSLLEILPNEPLLINFILDIGSEQLITANGVIRRIKGKELGVEITNWNNLEKYVWYYLLPTK
jgi:hypothetical protein